MLGPVEVVGWQSTPDRPVINELACYLALHRDRPASGVAIRAALRPDGEGKHSAKTLRSYLSLLRKALGPDLMPAGTGAGYRLSSDVHCDWERFSVLSSEGPDSDSLFEALALIRGQPFQGVVSGTYVWVFTEFLISDMEFAIAEVAVRAADAALEAEAAASARARSRSRSTTATATPASASRVAVASPIPDPPPVTTATFPESSPIGSPEASIDGGSGAGSG